MPKVKHYIKVINKTVKTRSQKQTDFIMELYNGCMLEDQEKIMGIAHELQQAIINKLPERLSGSRYPFSADNALELLGSIILYLAKIEKE